MNETCSSCFADCQGTCGMILNLFSYTFLLFLLFSFFVIYFTYIVKQTRHAHYVQNTARVFLESVFAMGRGLVRHAMVSTKLPSLFLRFFMFFFCFLFFSHSYYLLNSSSTRINQHRRQQHVAKCDHHNKYWIVSKRLIWCLYK